LTIFCLDLDICPASQRNPPLFRGHHGGLHPPDGSMPPLSGALGNTLLHLNLPAKRLVHCFLTGLLTHWIVASARVTRGNRRKSMTFWKRALTIGALALCCLTVTGAASPAGDNAPKHFLWKVTGSKGVVYLLGTIHAAKADFYPLPSIIEDSFEKADMLTRKSTSASPPKPLAHSGASSRTAAIRMATRLPIISVKSPVRISRRI
jgi:hypothetical protein